MNLSTRLPYIPGLDGIRALAVLAVLCYHANYSWALGAFLGVETFFVLSGFLITLLLLSEWRATGGINLKNFWLRRARRLLPAVWLLLLILPLLTILFARDALPHLKEDIPAALFYVTNWVYIFREVPYFETFGRPPLLQQLWSLAVEEQFYLLWPLVLLFLLRKLNNDRSRLWGAIILMIAISSGWMAVHYSPSVDSLRVYYGTDTRAAGFLVGAALAILWAPWKEFYVHSRGKLEVLGWSGVAALLIFYKFLNEFQPFLYRGGILLTALASAFVIIGASSPTTSLSKLFESRILRWIGTRSYSIYLWHWPVFMLSRPGVDIQLPALWVRVCQLAVTFGLAELSYRWVESPIRHQGFRSSLRSWQATFKLWPTPQKVGVGTGIICAGLLLIWQSYLQVPEVKPDTVHALQNNSSALDIVNRTPTKPSSPEPQQTPRMSIFIYPTATIEEKMNGVSSTPTTTPPGDVPEVTLIGDSIMQGAAPMIEDVLGQDIFIEAARKRRMEDMPAIIETLSEEGHLGPVVIIHVGSNRPFEGPVFDTVMKTLLEHSVERIIFINVHRPIGWEFYVNRQFAEGIARWPHAELIDWDAIAHTQQEWFIEDQTHLSYAGSKAYVTAIQGKIETAP
jgi:peptidoglycan/LPS O-acetylase OafA/YrhL